MIPTRTVRSRAAEVEAVQTSQKAEWEAKKADRAAEWAEKGAEMEANRFAKMDKDGNGTISQEEFESAPMGHGKRGRKGMDRMPPPPPEDQ